jgi:hypothetical protein
MTHFAASAHALIQYAALLDNVACLAEVVGLSDTGDFLIARSPYCQIINGTVSFSLCTIKMHHRCGI